MSGRVPGGVGRTWGCFPQNVVPSIFQPAFGWLLTNFLLAYLSYQHDGSPSSSSPPSLCLIREKALLCPAFGELASGSKKLLDLKNGRLFGVIHIRSFSSLIELSCVSPRPVHRLSWLLRTYGVLLRRDPLLFLKHLCPFFLF